MKTTTLTMTGQRNLWISLGLTAAMALAAGVAQAQPRDGAGRLGPPGAGFGPGPAFGLLHGPLADQLELSDGQRERIRAILENQNETAAPWHESMKTLGAELEEAIDTEPLDEEAVRAIARRLADVRVELTVARARTAQEVRSVLTPDQRETLGELRAQRGAHRGRPGVHGRPGGRAGFHRPGG